MKQEDKSRERHNAATRRYYLSHKQKWKLYALKRKKRIAEQVRKNYKGEQV